MIPSPPPGPAKPTPAIALVGEPEHISAHGDAERVEVTAEFVSRLAEICGEAGSDAVSTDPSDLAEASRDWWPLAMTWALESETAGLAAVVVTPSSVEQIQAIAKLCSTERIPLTTAGGRSGVSGASVPLHGGVVLDMCGITGILSVDDESLTANVAAGTFGDHFEHDLQRDYGLTAGHWPQSMALATVGGWVACRGAGQLSTRYGKIEDIVSGLDVVLADGTLIEVGDQPRQAVGPDLTQFFVGSEGTLGIITAVRLKLHPVATHERRGAWAFSSFADGLTACRQILRRGATPAVLRLYDAIESDRNYGTGEERCALIVLDEGDEPIVEGTWSVVEQELASAGAEVLDTALVEKWINKRNDVAALEQLIGGGLVVDTMEITAPWSRLDEVYDATIAAISGIDAVLAVSAHQSHAYLDGACLYFTFAGQPTKEVSGPTAAAAKLAFYTDVWTTGTEAVLNAGGSLSHHHGVGLNRSRFVRTALASGFDVFARTKASLDPQGILNPGKLGLDDPFGSTNYP